MRAVNVGDAELYTGDCLEILRMLPEDSAQTCITSPPYFGLRDYGHDGQIGQEPTPDAFVSALVNVFREVKRVLRDDGTLWLNLGDSYAAQRGGTHQPAETLAGGKGGIADDGKRVNRSRLDGYNPTRNASAIGLKHKDLIGIPWRVALALQADGWYLRQDIIWSKPNPMPESVKDRCTKSHEYIFMLSKSARYYYDHAAIKEPAIYSGITGQDESGYKGAQAFGGKHGKTDKQRGHSRRHAGFNDRWEAMTKAEQCSGMRNKRSVWEVPTRPYAGAHFATFPPDLIRPCVMAGCPAGGVVMDPFSGSGTTGEVALQEGRKYLGIELNPEYQQMAISRISPFAQQERLFA